MNKDTHIAMGLGMASCGMMVLHNCVFKTPLTTQELIVGTASAYIASFRPDDDLIDNRNKDDMRGLIKDAVASSSLPVAIYLIIRSWNLYDYTTFWNGNNVVVSTIISLICPIMLWGIMEAFTILSDHRKYSHSILWLLLYTGLWSMMYPGDYGYWWFAFGYASHLIIDLLNKKGEMLFFPLSIKIALRLCGSSGIINSILLYVGWIWYLIIVAVVNTHMFASIIIIAIVLYLNNIKLNTI